MRTVQQWQATLRDNGKPVYAWRLVCVDGLGYENQWVTEIDGTTHIPIESPDDFSPLSRIDSITVRDSFYNEAETTGVDGD